MKQISGTWWVRAALIAVGVPLLTACGTAAPQAGPDRVAEEVQPPPVMGTPSGAPASSSTPPSTPEATLTPVQGTPPVSEPGPAPIITPVPTLMVTGWRTDPPLGGRVGETAINTQVTLAGGTQASLEELAGGKSLLLYFFATW